MSFDSRMEIYEVCPCCRQLQAHSWLTRPMQKRQGCKQFLQGNVMSGVVVGATQAFQLCLLFLSDFLTCTVIIKENFIRISNQYPPICGHISSTAYTVPLYLNRAIFWLLTVTSLPVRLLELLLLRTPVEYCDIFSTSLDETSLASSGSSTTGNIKMTASNTYPCSLD